MDDVFVLLSDMPTTIKSFVVANSDMSFTIMINARLCHEQQLMAYEHELKHITNGDYDKKCSADLIELAAHNMEYI